MAPPMWRGWERDDVLRRVAYDTPEAVVECLQEYGETLGIKASCVWDSRMVTISTSSRFRRSDSRSMAQHWNLCARKLCDQLDETTTATRSGRISRKRRMARPTS